jgi:hypothetical protein
VDPEIGLRETGDQETTGVTGDKKIKRSKRPERERIPAVSSPDLLTF